MFPITYPKSTPVSKPDTVLELVLLHHKSDLPIPQLVLIQHKH